MLASLAPHDERIAPLLAAARADRVAKGGLRGDEWVEIEGLGLKHDTPVTVVTRVIMADGERVAYLTDIVPQTYLRQSDLGADFHGSILDLLLGTLAMPGVDIANGEHLDIRLPEEGGHDAEHGVRKAADVQDVGPLRGRSDRARRQIQTWGQ